MVNAMMGWFVLFFSHSKCIYFNFWSSVMMKQKCSSLKRPCIRFSSDTDKDDRCNITDIWKKVGEGVRKKSKNEMRQQKSGQSTRFLVFFFFFVFWWRSLNCSVCCSGTARWEEQYKSYVVFNEWCGCKEEISMREQFLKRPRDEW